MDPEQFNGDSEGLERFLLHVDNKFEMEPNQFHDDVRKIRYAGQLMKDRADKWYRSYHLQISERDATRIRGHIDLISKKKCRSTKLAGVSLVRWARCNCCARQPHIRIPAGRFLLDVLDECSTTVRWQLEKKISCMSD